MRLNQYRLCDVINTNPSYKLDSDFVQDPQIVATSERTFSVLKRLLVYFQSTMTEKRLNCLLLHVHKDIVDELNLKEHFGKY